MSNGLNARFRALPPQFLYRHVMTAALVLPTRDLPIHVGSNDFDLCEFQVHSTSVVSLRLGKPSYNEPPIRAIWLPQGGSALVSPADEYVFTPDFSGCSLCIDQLPGAEGWRAYHVEGGNNRIRTQYVDSPHAHGLGVAGHMHYRDYGLEPQGGPPMPRAFAFMYKPRSEAGKWHILVQKQAGSFFGVERDGSVGALTPQLIREITMLRLRDLRWESPDPLALDGYDKGPPASRVEALTAFRPL